MGPAEATSNMVIALINIKALASPEDVAEAYKTIYKAVAHPAQ